MLLLVYLVLYLPSVPFGSLVWYLARILGKIRGLASAASSTLQWRPAIGADAKTHKKMKKEAQSAATAAAVSAEAKQPPQLLYLQEFPL